MGLEIVTPSGEIRVHRGQHDNHAHEDLYVTIRDAFDAAERQLKAGSKKQRTAPPHKGGLQFDEKAA